MISQTATGQLVLSQHDGRKVYLVSHARTEQISNVLDGARAMARIKTDEFVVRAALLPSLPQQFRRLLHAKPSAQATLCGVARSYILLDIDGTRNALPWYDPFSSDREVTVAAVEELIKDLLPREFHGVSGWYGFTGGHGVKAGMNLRLLFCLTRPMDAAQLKSWLGYLRRRGVDTSVFSPAQQILVAPVILAGGMPDPVRVRSGLITGFRHLVKPPTESAIDAASIRDRRTVCPAATTSSVKSGGYAPLQRSPGGYQAALRRIGDGADQLGIHGAILSVVGVWMRTNGLDADVASLISDITKQLGSTHIDTLKHPQSYVAHQLASLPALVAEVGEMERARISSEAAVQQARMRTVVGVDRVLVTASASDAATRVETVVRQFVERVPDLVRRRNTVWQRAEKETYGSSYPARAVRTSWRPRGAVIVDVGVGKTAVCVAEVVTLIRAHPKIRVAYVVPEHKLAADIKSRLNLAAGSDVAEIWRGIQQPDPHDGTAKCVGDR